MLPAAFPQNLAQLRDALIEAVLLDDRLPPHCLQQCRLGDGFTAVHHQVEKGIEGPGAERDSFAVAEQDPSGGIQDKRPEPVLKVAQGVAGKPFRLRTMQLHSETFRNRQRPVRRLSSIPESRWPTARRFRRELAQEFGNANHDFQVDHQ